MIGLPRSTVEIVPYSNLWPGLFAEEAERLRAAIGEHTVAIEHIGSTSVPGLAAKPIIDILIAVMEISDVQKCVVPLESIGYEYRGELGIPGRHFFGKGETRTHNLHVVEIGSAHWRRHLRFRDYLREHDEVRNDYQALKEGLAEKHRHDREAYTDAKSEFIQGVEKAAAALKNQGEGE